MPETPDLIVIASYLQERVVGRVIDSVVELRPLALRTLTPEGDSNAFCAGLTIIGAAPRAKFLLLGLTQGRHIVINFMLAGALRHCAPDDAVRKRDYIIFGLDDGSELRYYDPRGMGKVYLCDDLAAVPGLAEAAPDALDPAFTLDAFRARLARQRGEIKGALTRGKLVGGIGNAYADEVLFRAGIYPFRHCTELGAREVEELYLAMRAVLGEAVVVLEERMGEDIDHRIRDFMAVHNKAGLPCPRCGQPISEVKSGKRVTNFCRRCQPGMLIRQ